MADNQSAACLDDGCSTCDNFTPWSSAVVPKMFRLIIVCISFVLLGFALLGGFVVYAQRVEPPPQAEQDISAITVPPAQQTAGVKRLREGTAFKNKHVFFRQTGDRTVLYTIEDNQRFVCLENLPLERILTAAQEKADRQFWKIDGEFTEFRRENFVLIHRAVIAQDPETIIPPAPLAP